MESAAESSAERRLGLSRRPLAACLAVALGTASLFTMPALATPPVGGRHISTGAFAPLARQAAPAHGGAVAALRATYGEPRAAVAGQIPVARAVDNCADSGPGSLRDAVDNASSGDTIDLTSLSCSTISLTTGAIVASVDDLTIDGPGAANLTIDANYSSRVLALTGAGTLTVNDLTVANGYDYTRISGGACILSAGSLDLNRSVVTGCYGIGFVVRGGATYSAGETTITDSVLTGNTAFGYDDGTEGYANASGGAAYAYGQMTIASSTISGNLATGGSTSPVSYSFIRGGGLYGRNGVEVTDSTISGNEGRYSGGGVAGIYGLAMTNSTVAGNTTDYGYGGGVFALFGTVTLDHDTISRNADVYRGGGGLYFTGTDAPATLQSTIIFGNTAAVAADADVGSYGTYRSIAGANNLIGTTTVPVPADTLSVDPLLASLADNGGPTQTMALGAGSPAIDAGNNVAGLLYDQRGPGFARVSGSASDIGAFEVQAAAPVPVQIPVPTLSQWVQWLMGGLVGLLALVGVSRRRRQPSR